MTALSYKAPPKLAEMLRSDAFARVAKGPVGSGKSSACIMEILRRAAQQQPDQNGERHTRCGIIRNTYRELRDTTRRTFEQWMPKAQWREADFECEMKFSLPDQTQLNCEVMFRSLNRPEDIKKLLSMEWTFAYLNEVREIPKQAVDIVETRIGRYPAKKDGGPTWFGWWGDTNPWYVGHWGQKLFKTPPPGYELYSQPGGRTLLAENSENLPPGYYERLCHGKDAEWIRVYIDGEDAASDVGSVYGLLLERYEPQTFSYPLDGVYASYDLGFSDSTAIWFWRVNGHGGLDFIDYYENHGKTLSHYFEIVEASGYDVAQHWLPHDAAARTLAAEKGSVEDQFRSKFKGKVQIGPRASLIDGIQAGRWLLEQDCRFHAKCEQGLEVLRAYHYEWDDEAKIYAKTPEHDWSSHGSDAFRYAALVAKHVMKLQPKVPVQKRIVVPSLAEAYKLDDLFAYNEKRGQERERI